MFLKLSFILAILFAIGSEAEYQYNEVTGYDEEQFTEAVAILIQNLRGISCMTETLQNLKADVIEFSYLIKRSCKQKVSKTPKADLEDSDKLITLIDKLVCYNKRICKNIHYNQEKDADDEPSTACSDNLELLLKEKYWGTYFRTRNDVKTKLEKSYKNSDVCERMALITFNIKIHNFEHLFDQCVQIVQSSN